MFRLFIVWGLPVLAVAFLVLSVYEIIHLCKKRKFYKRLIKSAQENKYRVSTPRKMFSSRFRYSSTPDIIVEGARKKFLIRYIDTFDDSRCFVFPTEEFYVSFSKLALTLGFDMTENFKHLPKLDKSFLAAKEDQSVIKVLILGPKIGTVTAMSDDLKTTKSVYNKEMMFDWLVCDQKGFMELREAETSSKYVSSVKY